jgi:hypothetical protein
MTEDERAEWKQQVLLAECKAAIAKLALQTMVRLYDRGIGASELIIYAKRALREMEGK